MLAHAYMPRKPNASQYIHLYWASCPITPGVGGTGNSPAIKLCSSHGLNVLLLRFATLSARLRTSRFRLPSLTGLFSSLLGVAAAVRGTSLCRHPTADGTIVSLPSCSSLSMSRAPAPLREDAAEFVSVLRILTPPAAPFSSIDTLVLVLNVVEPDTSLSRLAGFPPLPTLELPTVDVDAVLALLLPIFAALSFALTRAALASRSDAASLAAMPANVTGDCCEVGRRWGALRGRRELVFGGERAGDSGGGWECLVVGADETLVSDRAGCLSAGEDFLSACVGS